MRKITIGIAVVMLVGVVLIGIDRYCPIKRVQSKGSDDEICAAGYGCGTPKIQTRFWSVSPSAGRTWVTAHQKERYLIEHWNALDAWGHAFQYDLMGGAGDAYDLYSVGEDGIAHSSDDIRPPP